MMVRIVRMVRQFLSQLGNASKSLIYIGTYARGEVMGNTLTILTASPLDCIPPIGGRLLRLCWYLADLLRGSVAARQCGTVCLSAVHAVLRRASVMVPMPPNQSVAVTGGSTDLLSLPTSEKKSGEKSW
jgi:hypothetical protein